MPPNPTCNSRYNDGQGECQQHCKVHSSSLGTHLKSLEARNLTWLGSHVLRSEKAIVHGARSGVSGHGRDAREAKQKKGRALAWFLIPNSSLLWVMLGIIGTPHQRNLKPKPTLQKWSVRTRCLPRLQSLSRCQSLFLLLTPSLLTDKILKPLFPHTAHKASKLVSCP